jgi:hypothetical protein
MSKQEVHYSTTASYRVKYIPKAKCSLMRSHQVQMLCLLQYWYKNLRYQEITNHDTTFQLHAIDFWYKT